MKLIQWSAALAVGHDEIDAQHQQLVEIINRLHEAMMERRGREVLAQVFEDLEKYTRFHFATEERLMDRHHYAASADHKKAHADLIDKLLALYSDFERGKLTISMETMNFLKSWLTDHIGRKDKSLSAFLSKPT